MSQSPVKREGPNPLEWVESAMRLLRSAPPGALLCYYIGSAPCLLGLLYFWADMSRGAFAAERLVESAFNVAALYIWMKCWQAVFLSKLRAHLFMEKDEPWTMARVGRMALIQAALQPPGLFLRFIAANVLIPYVWTYSFFAGTAILGDGREPSLRTVLRRSWREAGLWWRQTHLALLCLFGFALFICLNINIVCGLLPYVLRMFLGIETVFTRDGLAMFNTTFFAATFAATYLCFDPIRKAVFLIRHFHGQSLQSGEDLRVELRAIRRRTRLAVAALLFFATPLAAPLTSAQAKDVPSSPAAPRAAQVDSSQLDSSLDRVLERREYGWRFPRSAKPEAEKQGNRIARMFARWYDRVNAWMDKLQDWLKRLFESKKDDQKEATAPFHLDWGTIAKIILIILLIAVIVLIVMMFWRARRKQSEVVLAEALVAVPDLNEESVTADQLPEDGWLQLARELMSKGELRLSLRAFYLATLAHLGQRELIRLARYKSNHDYDRELQRRARGNASLLEAFDANLFIFEGAWYGDHEISPMTLDGFAQNFERIRAC